MWTWSFYGKLPKRKIQNQTLYFNWKIEWTGKSRQTLPKPADLETGGEETQPELASPSRKASGYDSNRDPKPKIRSAHQFYTELAFVSRTRHPNSHEFERKWEIQNWN